MVSIPQSNPGASSAGYKDEIDRSIQRVMASGWYILGQEVAAFEREFANFIGASNVIGVANGTDAITIALEALGVGPGCAVVTVSHTAVASIVGVQLSGATPLLVDIDEHYTLDPQHLEAAAASAKKQGLRLAAILPVHLYGQPADLDPIIDFAKVNGAVVIEDCAQAHGALWKGRMVGGITEAASFSFYPTKNLGAIGDGGATSFRDPEVVARGMQLRQYGWDAERRCQHFGRNSRLDELQAAILRAKLKGLAADIARRREIAAAYDEGLRNLPLTLPKVREGAVHAYHQYVVSVANQNAFRESLVKAGVGTAIHYAPANHLHPAYAKATRVGGALPATEEAAKHVVSLPMFPELTDGQVSRVIDAVRTTLI